VVHFEVVISFHQLITGIKFKKSIGAISFTKKLSFINLFKQLLLKQYPVSNNYLRSTVVAWVQRVLRLRRYRYDKSFISILQ